MPFLLDDPDREASVGPASIARIGDQAGRKDEHTRTSVKTVTENMPKMLGFMRGMSQKGKKRVIPLFPRNTGTKCFRSTAGVFPVCVIDMQRGKPIRVPECNTPGKRSARKADIRAGMGSWKKPMPSCNGKDRGCAARQHHPTGNRANFHVLPRREKRWSPFVLGNAMERLDGVCARVP